MLIFSKDVSKVFINVIYLDLLIFYFYFYFLPYGIINIVSKQFKFLKGAKYSIHSINYNLSCWLIYDPLIVCIVCIVCFPSNDLGNTCMFLLMCWRRVPKSLVQIEWENVHTL